jgi:hypothetical protein
VPILVGTSGWQYRHWRGLLYPPDVPQKRWLEHYAGLYATVENDGTFYRLPARETFGGWQARTPDDFVMAIKASRFLTHVKRLRDPAEPVQRLMLVGGPPGPPADSALADRGLGIPQIARGRGAAVAALRAPRPALLARPGDRMLAGRRSGLRLFQQRPVRRGHRGLGGLRRAGPAKRAYRHPHAGSAAERGVEQVSVQADDQCGDAGRRTARGGSGTCYDFGQSKTRVQ